MSVPLLPAYITLTIGRIFYKPGENVETLVSLIVSKFHKHRFIVDVIMTSFLFSKLFLSEAALLKEKQLCAKENNHAAPDCDTSDSDLVFGVFRRNHLTIFCSTTARGISKCI